MIRNHLNEPADEWEFKTVCSSSGIFNSMCRLKTLIAQESDAGWIFLEKLDASRVRFKRPIRARERDVRLPPDVDPYRTQVD